MSESVLMRFDISGLDGSQLEQLAKNLGISQKEFKKLVEAQKQAAAAMKELEKATGLDKMKIGFKEVESEIKKVKDEASKTAQALAKAEAKAHDMNKEFDKARMDKAHADAIKMNKELDDMKKKAASVSSEIKDKMSAAFDKVQAAANKVGIAMGAMGGLGIKNFAEFEKGVAQIQTISSASFDEITKVTKKMALESGTSLIDLNSALYDTVSSIGDVEGKFKVLEAANKLSIGGFTSATKSVDVLTTVINAYKMNAEDATKISDILIQTQNLGKVTVDQLASSLGNVIPTAAMVNVSFEQLSTGMALLTSNGINAAESGTALNAMFSELAKGGTDADKMFKKVFGTNFANYMKNGGDLGEVLRKMGEQAKKSGQSLLDIFNIRAVKGAATIFGDLERWDDFSRAMSEAAGTTEAAYAKMLETLDRQIGKIKESLRQASINIGSALAPIVSDFANRLAKIDFEKVFSQENINRITSMAKTLGILLVTVKGFGAIGGIIKTVNTLGTAFQAFTGAGAAAGQVATLTARIKAMSGALGLGASAAGVTVLGLGAVAGGAVYAGVKYAEYRSEAAKLTETLKASEGTFEARKKALEAQVEIVDKLIKRMEVGKIKAWDAEMKAMTNQANNPNANSEQDKKMQEQIKKVVEAQKEYQKISEEIRNSEATFLDVELQVKSEKAKEEAEKTLSELKSMAEKEKIKVEIEAKIDGLNKAKEQLEDIRSKLDKRAIFEIKLDDINDTQLKNLILKAQKLAVEGKNLTGIFKELNTTLDSKRTTLEERVDRAIADLNKTAKEANGKYNLDLKVDVNKDEILKMMQEANEYIEKNGIEANVKLFLEAKEAEEKTKAFIDLINSTLITPQVNLENVKKIDTAIKDVVENGFKKLEETRDLEAKHKLVMKMLADLRTYAAAGSQIADNLMIGVLAYEAALNSKRNGTTTTSSSGKKSKPEWQTALENYKKDLEALPKFWDATGVTDIEQVKSKVNNVKTLMQSLAKGNKDTLFAQYKKDLDILQEELNKLNLAKIFEDYERNSNSIKTINEILGINDKDAIKSQLNEVKTAISNMVKELERQGLTEIEIKAYVESSGLLETYKTKEAESKASEELEKAKKAEKEAIKNMISTMDKFGSDMKELGEDLGSTFLKVMGEIMSSVSKLASGLNQFNTGGGFGSIGNMFSGLLGGVGGLGGLASGLSSLSGLATAGLTAFQLGKNLISSMSGDAKREEIEQQNEEQKAVFEAAQDEIYNFIDSIKAARSSINSYSNSMIDYTAASPTLANIERITKNYDLYISAMVEGLDESLFGGVTALRKSSEKVSGLLSSSREETFFADEIKSSDILRALGMRGTQISLMSEAQLRQLNDKLKTFGRGDLSEALGANYVDSTLEEWKLGIEEYVRQLDKMRTDQENLLKNSTLAAFEGIDLKSYKQLVEEYTDMYEQLGLESAAYMDQIEEMARNTGALVTAMQDVRSTWIDTLSSTGTANFSESMSSYFSSILKNAAQVVYDVAYSSIDDYLTNEFEEISNKLVSMKQSGILDFTGFWDDFNFNKILEADRIQTDYARVIDDLRYQLESRGISTSLIDSILPATELSEKIQNMREMISNAMSTALDNNSFLSFTESLGQGIYDSVKDSLIQAFSESEVYKAYLNRFFDTATIEQQLNQVSTAQEGFNVIQEYLNNLDYQLESAGLGRGDNVLASSETTSVGENYYTPDSTGLTIQIYQYFDQIYGDDAVYRIAKQAAKEGIIEADEEAKIMKGGLA